MSKLPHPCRCRGSAAPVRVSALDCLTARGHSDSADRRSTPGCRLRRGHVGRKAHAPLRHRRAGKIFRNMRMCGVWGGRNRRLLPCRHGVARAARGVLRRALQQTQKNPKTTTITTTTTTAHRRRCSKVQRTRSHSEANSHSRVQSGVGGVVGRWYNRHGVSSSLPSQVILIGSSRYTF